MKEEKYKMILKASLRDWSTRYANSNWIKEFISVDLEILTQELQPFPTLLPLPDLPLIDFNKFSTTITRNRNSNPKKAKDVQDLKPTNDTQNNANSENNLRLLGNLNQAPHSLRSVFESVFHCLCFQLPTKKTSFLKNKTPTPWF